MHPQAQPHAHHPHYPQQQGYPQQGYPQGAVPTQPPAASGGEYEFGEAENRTISKTYGRMRAWGVVSILLGGCQVWVALGNGGAVLPMEIFGAIGGVVSVLVGVTFLASAASFERVVKSKGNDVALMMHALDKLTVAFTIMLVVAALSFVGGAVLGAMGKM